jgi:uncharacterized protein YkwD
VKLPHSIVLAVGVVALLGVGLRGEGDAKRVQDAEGCPRSGEFPRSAEIRTTRLAILCLLNVERAKRGLSGLRYNGVLELSSQRHSEDMAARDFFEHDTPDGVDPQARIEAAGYAGSWTGENLYVGTGFEATPVRALRSWMKSPGHRANILRPQFTEVGVGIAYESPRPGSSERGALYTTNFGG